MPLYMQQGYQHLRGWIKLTFLILHFQSSLLWIRNIKFSRQVIRHSLSPSHALNAISNVPPPIAPLYNYNGPARYSTPRPLLFLCCFPDSQQTNMNKLFFVIKTVVLCEVGTKMLLLFEATNVLSSRLSSRRTASQFWGTLPYIARNCCSSAPYAIELFRSKFRYPKASVARSWHL